MLKHLRFRADNVCFVCVIEISNKTHRLIAEPITPLYTLRVLSPLTPPNYKHLVHYT